MKVKSTISLFGCCDPFFNSSGLFFYARFPLQNNAHSWLYIRRPIELGKG
jgi:hypothetical protein